MLEANVNFQRKGRKGMQPYFSIKLQIGRFENWKVDFLILVPGPVHFARFGSVRFRYQ
jgi:hypothetical protein